MDPPSVIRMLHIESVSIPFIGHDNAGCTYDVSDGLASEVSISQGTLIVSKFQGDTDDGASSKEVDDAESTNEQKTSHQIRKEKAAEAWESSRAFIFQRIVECSSFPTVLCQHCNEKNG